MEEILIDVMRENAPLILLGGYVSFRFQKQMSGFCNRLIVIETLLKNINLTTKVE